MPYILTGSSIIICPHGARLSHSPTGAKSNLMLGGHLVYFYDDNYFVSACALGCRTIKWSGYFPDLVFNGSKYILTHESQASVYDHGSGFKGNALILFFQMDVTTDDLVKLLSKKG